MQYLSRVVRERALNVREDRMSVRFDVLSMRVVPRVYFNYPSRNTFCIPGFFDRNNIVFRELFALDIVGELREAIDLLRRI